MFDNDDIIGLILEIIGDFLSWIGHINKIYLLMLIGISMSVIGYYLWWN